MVRIAMPVTVNKSDSSMVDEVDEAGLTKKAWMKMEKVCVKKRQPASIRLWVMRCRLKYSPVSMICFIVFNNLTKI